MKGMKHKPVSSGKGMMSKASTKLGKASMKSMGKGKMSYAPMRHVMGKMKR